MTEKFWIWGAIALSCLAVGHLGARPAWSQETIPVDITITPVRVDTGEVTRVTTGAGAAVTGGSVNAAGETGTTEAGAGGAAGAIATTTTAVSTAADNTLTLEACGGVGDVTRTGIENFKKLTQERDSVMSLAERNRIERELQAQALRLPETITEDFSSRELALGQSGGCDDLAASVETLMTQVVDYLGALEDARAGVLW
ncbi:MAG: hypothetical protein AAFY57_13565 [Cyanobacteria bacterium J06642_2]